MAKKVPGVPASSSGCERMFSIAGNIFSIKRRHLKAKLFECLVFCKLNEFYLDYFNFFIQIIHLIIT